MKKKLVASVSLSHMNEKGLQKIIAMISRMGYDTMKDFRVNYYGGDSLPELAIMNVRLKKDLKLLGTLKIGGTTKQK